MNEKQLKFVQHYIESGNQTESYKLAYGVADDNVAAAGASRLLRSVKMIDYLTNHQNKVCSELSISREEILKILAGIARNGSNDMAKIKACEVAAKLHGMHITVRDIVQALQPDQYDAIAEYISKNQVND